MRPGMVQLEFVTRRQDYSHKVAGHASHRLGQGNEDEGKDSCAHVPSNKTKAYERETVFIDVPDASHLRAGGAICSSWKTSQNGAGK